MRSAPMSMNWPCGGSARSTRCAMYREKATSPAITMTKTATMDRKISVKYSPLFLCLLLRFALEPDCCDGASLELHDTVAQGAEPERRKIEQVVLMVLPRLVKPLLGQDVRRPLNIPGREVNGGQRTHFIVPQSRYTNIVVSCLHVIHEAADILRNQLGLQGPRSVGIAERRRQIRYVSIHHALVRHRISEGNLAPVNGDHRSTEHLEFQPRSGNHQVGVEMLAASQQHAGLGEAFDFVGRNRRLAGAHRLEQVSVRDKTEALIPRVVSGRHVFSYVELGSQLPACCPDEQLFGLFRLASRAVVKVHGQQHVLATDKLVRER